MTNTLFPFMVVDETSGETYGTYQSMDGALETIQYLEYATGHSFMILDSTGKESRAWGVVTL
jgi:hypothetical protein